MMIIRLIQHLIGILLLVTVQNGSYDRYAVAMSIGPTGTSKFRYRQQQLVKASPIEEVNDQDCLGMSRRSILVVIASTLPSFLSPTLSTAQQEQDVMSSSVALEENNDNNKRGGDRPFAPLAALLPAARLKVVVDQMYSLSKTLSTTRNDIDNQYKTLEKMNQLWINRPPLFPTSTTISSEQQQIRVPLKQTTSHSFSISPLAQITTSVSVANKEQYRMNRLELTSIPDRVVAIFNQADVQRQWGILKYQETKLEQQSDIRLAFNYYTKQLIFSSSTYTLTVPNNIRKQMIRNDQLPTLSTVITSDLDLRDLYRNDFITNIEDAIAEINYQLTQKSSTSVNDNNELDVFVDVIDLIDQAHTALTNWFDLIPPLDVQEALATIATETT